MMHSSTAPGRARIGELLQPFAALTDAQLAQVEQHLALLLRWNARTNLTAVRAPEEMVTRHFGESLFAASQWLAPDSQASVVDVGSGAGFPGLPLKIWAPEISLTLVESQNKKATFLREAIRALRLQPANVLSARAETLQLEAGLVTLRAVENFSGVLPVAARLVRPGGSLGMLVGEAQAGQAHALLPEWSWHTPVAIPHSRARVLLLASRP